MNSSNGHYEAQIVIRARSESPAIEVLHEGNTYIEGRQGTEYALRFRNNTGKRVLIVASVDGLSVINGKPAGLDGPGYTVDPWSTVTIPGWKVDSSTAGKFTFAQKGSSTKSYAEHLGTDPSNLGAIGIAVFTEKEVPKVQPVPVPIPYPVPQPQPWMVPSYPWRPYPVYYGTQTGTPIVGLNTITTNAVAASAASTPMFNSDSQTASLMNQSTGVLRSAQNTRRITADSLSGPMGTAFGPATKFETSSTSFERSSTTPVETFVFIYDSLENFKRAGIPTDAFRPKRTETAHSRLTNRRPFPASPDPDNNCQPPMGWHKR